LWLRASELRFRGLIIYAGTIPNFVLKLPDCVNGAIAYAPDRLDPVDRSERPWSDLLSRDQQFWKLGRDGGSLNATSRFCVLGNIGNQMPVFLSEAHASGAADVTNREAAICWDGAAWALPKQAQRGRLEKKRCVLFWPWAFW
jgi:hypothetical protein